MLPVRPTLHGVQQVMAVEGIKLIVPMLQRFTATDPVFAKPRRSAQVGGEPSENPDSIRAAYNRWDVRHVSAIELATQASALDQAKLARSSDGRER